VRLPPHFYSVVTCKAKTGCADTFPMQETDSKEPWLAVWLSSIFTGIGQIYGGNRSKGVIFLLVGIALALSALSCLLWFVMAPSKAVLVAGILLFCLAVIFSFYNYFDAYATAKEYNLGHGATLSLRKKQPFLSLFLSSMVPGLGQIYNSQWIKGIGILIGISAIEAVLEVIPKVGHFVSIIFGILATLWILNDAYSSATRINDEPSSLIERFGRKKVFTVVALWLLAPILLAGNLAFGIRAYVISPYKIPTMAMAPTILQGDRIFANKWVYRTKNPKRGDIIVFQYPLDVKKDFIKRVIGLPNEKIQIKDGNVYADGKLIDTPQIPRQRVYANHEDWRYGKVGQIIEVPKDSYFVLGDNSARSADSRQWGFVPRRNIKAKASFIFWPPSRQQRLDVIPFPKNKFLAESIQNGIRPQYYPSGALQAEWLYKNGSLEGVSKEYYETGELEAETPYVNNQIHGVRKVHFKNGRVEFERTYAQGVSDGPMKWYYETGELHGEMTVRNELPDGIGKVYFKNGKLEGESHLEMGTGSAKEFYESGAIKKETVLKNNVPVSVKEYDPQGNLISPAKESATK